MTLLYPMKTMYFFRLNYMNDNFIYQSRGFDGLRNLKISLTSFIRNREELYIEILTLNPRNTDLTIINKGEIPDIEKMLYNGRHIE